MKFKILTRICLPGLFWSMAFSYPQLNTSVFQTPQHFWGYEKAGDKPDKIAVLPVYVSKYRESKPCDSCHWLSSNGLEFILENYLLKLAGSGSPHFVTDLIHPENQFIISNKLNLEKLVRESKLPWQKVFYGFREKLIFREKDNFTPQHVKNNLNQLGGNLGANYLLMIQDLKMNVFPRSSNAHVGKLSFQFYLLFWNVKGAYPEWIIFFKTETGNIDLDVTIDKYLTKKLTPYIHSLPGRIKNHRAKEPR